MSRFRLRYQSTDLEMPTGEFVVGRSSSCNLALDDGLVSRRHAIIRCAVDGATVEDLGSRNGVLVNGTRIEGPQPLSHRDTIRIGSQELTWVDRESRDREDPSTTEQIRCDLCGKFTEVRARECTHCGNAMPLRESASGGHTIELHPGDAPAASADGVREDAAFLVVASIAEKALGMSRFEEAERLLDRHLELLLERARGGVPFEPQVFERAVGYALRLAEGRSSVRWLGYVVELHCACRRLMAEKVIDRMHERVRKSRYGVRAPIEEYVAVLEGMTGRLSASDRFLVKRLEALQRVITAYA